MADANTAASMSSSRQLLVKQTNARPIHHTLLVGPVVAPPELAADGDGAVDVVTMRSCPTSEPEPHTAKKSRHRCHIPATQKHSPIESRDRCSVITSPPQRAEQQQSTQTKEATGDEDKSPRIGGCRCGRAGDDPDHCWITERQCSAIQLRRWESERKVVYPEQRQLQPPVISSERDVGTLFFECPNISRFGFDRAVFREITRSRAKDASWWIRRMHSFKRREQQ